MQKMLIIKDLKDWFWSTFPNWEKPVSLDIESIKKYFEQEQFDVEITSYSTFNFSRDYKGYYVLYGSAEDYSGGSKNYIEDIILWLDNSGAILLPKFKYLRAHENKVMMELLRNDFKNEQLRTIKTRTYASLEKLKSYEMEFPVIIKSAAGSGGEGVFLAHNYNELKKYSERVSRLVNELQFYYLSLVNVKQKLLRKPPVLIHNTKFIVQNFIEGLDGDYKVLIFGTHYFVLHRLNRDNDFRASGSGKFSKNNGNEIEELLDFAYLCKSEIDAPHLSLDIGFDSKNFHLIEFQCLAFGFKAMSMSEMHYEKIEKGWKTVEGKIVPEYEFCFGVLSYLDTKM